MSEGLSVIYHLVHCQVRPQQKPGRLQKDLGLLKNISTKVERLRFSTYLWLLEDLGPLCFNVTKQHTKHSNVSAKNWLHNIC